jgi:hypothetical protein
LSSANITISTYFTPTTSVIDQKMRLVAHSTSSGVGCAEKMVE